MVQSSCAACGLTREASSPPSLWVIQEDCFGYLVAKLAVFLPDPEAGVWEQARENKGQLPSIHLLQRGELGGGDEPSVPSLSPVISFQTPPASHPPLGPGLALHPLPQQHHGSFSSRCVFHTADSRLLRWIQMDFLMFSSLAPAPPPTQMVETGPTEAGQPLSGGPKSDPEWRLFAPHLCG